MKKTALIMICIMICYYLFHGYETIYAAKHPQSQKVIMISIPGLSFHEIQQGVLNRYPQLLRLVQNGAVGALNVRTPYRGIEDSYLTIGAGAPASSIETNGMHAEEIITGEKASNLYYRYNGRTAASFEIIVPEISSIHRINEHQNYQANPGLLGETLENAGISLVVIGNRDRGIEPKRAAPLMLMNRQGGVPNGFIDQRTMIQDVERPYGVKINYSFIQEQLKRTSDHAVILVELGDLDRLYADKANYAEQRFDQLKSQILDEIDQFIGEAVQILEVSDSLFVFSPQVHQEAFQDKFMLAPTIWYKHKLKPGILISNTTRRLGVITNYDIAPSILREFNLQSPSEFRGSQIRSEPRKDSLQWLQTELNSIKQTYKLRPKLLYSFVTFEIIVLLLGLLFAILNRSGFSSAVTVPLLSILIAPLVMLCLQWVAGVYVPIVMVGFFIVILSLGWLLERFFSLLWSIGIISTATVLIILVDGILGAEAMKRSVLGYDPMIGARYYGIGNEYMGILIGATILAASVGMHYFQFTKRYIMGSTISLVFAAVMFYLAAPLLGTNAGGAITASIAFGIAWVRMFCKNVLRHVHLMRLLLFTAGFGFAALLGLWLLNHVLSINVEQQSHIGKTMALLSAGEFDAIYGMILRKLSMNWHLIGVSSWSKVFITSLFVMAVIVMRPRGVFHRWQQRYPYLMYGFSANTVGAIIVLLINDSGIVAAATMIVYVAVPMLCLKLQDNRASHSS